MDESNDLSKSVIFPKGDAVPQPLAKNFIGQACLSMLTGFDTGVSIGNGTFEPGCRNNRHSHPGGQILLVTRGHGAAKDSWFVHLAVEAGPSEGPAEWMEPVTDEEYNKLN